MSADDILRLHYQERQFLGATDFEDEQSYLLESRRRNNVSQRTWGILSGLEIKETVTGNGVWVVSAGAMIDAYGREVLVSEDTPLDPLEIGGKLTNRAATTLKIWLSYATEETSPAAAGYVGCQDAAINTRTRESFRLIYQDDPVPFDTQTPEARASWPAATDDLPDDPKEKAWPVLLGTITWSGTAITAPVNTTGRNYSGLRGSHVLSQREQFDISPAQVRLVVDKDEKAVLTTKLGTDADPETATTALYLRTNDVAGGAGVNIDVDDVALGKTLSVKGNATLSGTVGNGFGKLVLEVDSTSNLATLTRKNGTRSNHDIAIRTADGGGGNSILIDKDNVALRNVTVGESAVLKKGLDTWDRIVLQQTNGGDDSDAMVISRFPPLGATNANDLRVQIGDDMDGTDRFVVGPVYHADQQFKEQFIVDNAGNVTATGNAKIGGKLSTVGTVNGRNTIVDGAKLDTIAPGAKNVVVNEGNVSHGFEIPIPLGFTQDQCYWIVIINPPLLAPPLPPTFHSNTDSRMVNSQVTFGISPFDFTVDGNADYLMICVKGV